MKYKIDARLIDRTQKFDLLEISSADSESVYIIVDRKLKKVLHTSSSDDYIDMLWENFI